MVAEHHYMVVEHHDEVAEYHYIYGGPAVAGSLSPLSMGPCRCAARGQNKTEPPIYTVRGGALHIEGPPAIYRRETPI